MPLMYQFTFLLSACCTVIATRRSYNAYEDLTLVGAHDDDNDLSLSTSAEWDETDYYLLDMIERTLDGTKLSSVKGLAGTKMSSVKEKAALFAKQANEIRQEMKDEWKNEQKKGKAAFLANPKINVEKLKETEKLVISDDAISKIVDYFLTDVTFWSKAMRFAVDLARAIVVANADPAAAKTAMAQIIEPSLDFAFDALRKFTASFAELFQSPDSVAKKLLQIVSNVFCKLDAKKIAVKVKALLFGMAAKAKEVQQRIGIKFDTVAKKMATQDSKIERLKLKLEEMKLAQLKQPQLASMAKTADAGQKGHGGRGRRRLQIIRLIKSGAKKAKKALKLFIRIIADLQWTLTNKLVEKIIHDVKVDGDPETSGIHGIVNAFLDTWLESVPEVLKNTVKSMDVGIDISKATAAMLMDYVDRILPWKSKAVALKERIQKWFKENMRETCEAKKISAAQQSDFDAYDMNMVDWYEEDNDEEDGVQVQEIPVVDYPVFHRDDSALLILDVMLLAGLIACCVCGAVFVGAVIGCSFAVYAGDRDQKRGDAVN